MKKSFIPISLMALAIGLSACSSEELTPPNGGGNSPFANGGYIKMAINLPTNSSPRAANDDFNNGKLEEYDVKDAMLILFQGGDNEDGATFHSAYNLAVNMATEGTNPSNITSTTKIIKQVNEDVKGETLYGYIVLNNNGLIKMTDATHLSVNGKNMNAGEAESTTNINTFKNFRESVVEEGADKFKTAGFFMSNAPLSNKKGGEGSKPTGAIITSLVNVSEMVYQSKAEAEKGKAAEVFVERALAKVTMQPKANGTLAGGDVNIVGSTNKNYKVLGWKLDITNKKSYLGRNYDPAWNELITQKIATAGESYTPNYRFIGSKPLRTSGGGSDLYRTYWGQDPNYENEYYMEGGVNKLGDHFNYLDNTAAIDGNFGADAPQYCMENTFDVSNMKTAQITRAIVKVQLNDGNTFYTFNDDNSTLYDDANKTSRIKAAIVNNIEVINKLKADRFSGTLSQDMITLSLSEREAKTGKILLNGFTINDGASFDQTYTLTDIFPSASTATDNLNDKLGLGNIYEYKDGIAYYPIRIKHFGDELTPWNNGEATINPGTPGSSTTNNPYGSQPASDNNYLGRFGVLRNNWYDISINSIKNVGTAEVPSIDINKDNNYGDEVNNYISVRINILSWAMRKQSEDL